MISKKQKILLFITFLLPSIFMLNPFGTIMSDTTLGATVSIIDRGTLELNPENSFDQSYIDGRFYSGLPIGATILAMPYYLALKGLIDKIPDKLFLKSIFPSFFSIKQPRVTLKSVFFLQMIAVLLLIAPLLSFFQVQLVSFFKNCGLDIKAAVFYSLVFLFGSFTLSFIGMYSKQLIASLIVWTAVIYSINHKNVLPRGERLALGSMIGIALLTDYMTGIFVFFYFSYRLMSKNFKGLYYELIPILIAISGVFFYNWFIFNDIIFGPYSARAYYLEKFNVPLPFMGEEISGMDLKNNFNLRRRVPNIKTSFNLLFSLHSGIFIYCPWLLFSVACFIKNWKDINKKMPHYWIFLVFSAVVLILISTLEDKFSWASPLYYGPRYLMIAVFFPFISIIYLEQSKFKYAFRAVLIFLSLLIFIGASGIPAIQAPTFSEEQNRIIESPFYSLILRAWENGFNIPISEYYGMSKSFTYIFTISILTISIFLIKKVFEIDRNLASPE